MSRDGFKINTTDIKKAGFDDLNIKEVEDDDPTNFDGSGGITREEMRPAEKQQMDEMQLRNLRIFKKDSLEISAGSNQTAEAQHNLGYPPTFLAYGRIESAGFPNGYFQLPYFFNDGSANPRVLVNVTDKEIAFFSTFSPVVVKIFYILYESNLNQL